MLSLPIQLLLFMLAGWVNRQQQQTIEYLKAENTVLREQPGERRVRFTDAQRRRLARAAKPLGRARLRELSTIVTPDTLLRWYHELVAAKYDGSAKRSPGRPRGMSRALLIFCERRLFSGLILGDALCSRLLLGMKSIEGSDERLDFLPSLDTAELLLRLDDRSTDPANDHPAALPTLHVL